MDGELVERELDCSGFDFGVAAADEPLPKKDLEQLHDDIIFCHAKEDSITHIMLLCDMLWTPWKSLGFTNKICLGLGG